MKTSDDQVWKCQNHFPEMGRILKRNLSAQLEKEESELKMKAAAARRQAAESVASGSGAALAASPLGDPSNASVSRAGSSSTPLARAAVEAAAPPSPPA